MWLMLLDGFPTGIETLHRHSRLANWLLIATIVAVFVLTGANECLGNPEVMPWILNGWSLKGLLGSSFLHAHWEHLIGNIFFLVLFGNVICRTVGPWKYLALYFSASFLADAIHLICGGGPAVGASGAISGLCGMTLALFPFNRMEYPNGSVEELSGWDLRVWHFCALHFVWDIIGAVRHLSGVAYAAHLGGFAAGIALGLLFLHRGWITLTQFDNVSLYEKLTGKTLEREEVEVEAEGE